MQRSHSNTFTPINNPMDQTHEPDEHLFDDDYDNMDLSGLPHGDLLHDTSHDPAWEPDYDSYELPPSYEEESTGHRYPQGPTLALTDDPQTTSSYPPFSPPAPSQPQPVPQPRPRLRRVLARISSSSSPPLSPVTTYSHALSPPRQAIHDRTSTSSSSSSSNSPDSIDGGVPLDPTPTPTPTATATATVHALICHHAVPLPPPCEPIPARCPPCTATMHRAYTLNMKMEWDLARLDPDTSAAERTNARCAYFRARADEQNYLDGLEDGGQDGGGSNSNSGGGGGSGRAEEALREAARRHRGVQRAVFFEAGTPLASRGRPAGAFKRESRHYVPGRWVGEWEDTSGMRQSFSEYYDVMADYDEEAIVDDEEDEEYCDEDEEYYDEDDVKYSDEEDEKYKYYDDEDYAADSE